MDHMQAFKGHDVIDNNICAQIGYDCRLCVVIGFDSWEFY